MTAAVPFPLPPGRILSSWRRELAAFRPGRLRLVHLLLHRVEALVRTARLRSLDPLRAALLGQLSVEAPLDRLRVDDAVLRRWLGDLSADGLVESPGAGWRLTDRGRVPPRLRRLHGNDRGTAGLHISQRKRVRILPLGSWPCMVRLSLCRRRWSGASMRRCWWSASSGRRSGRSGTASRWTWMQSSRPSVRARGRRTGGA